MSLDKCLPGLVAEGKISQEQADHAATVFGRRQRYYARDMAPAAAEALAGEDAATAVEREAARKKRLTLLTVKAQKDRLVDIVDEAGRVDPKRLPGVIHRVEARRSAIAGFAFAHLDGFLAAERKTILGRLRDPALMDDIVREAHGEETGNLAAKEMAQAWLKAAEELRRRFNAAGGDIGKIEDWGLPHAHDSRAVRLAAGPDGTPDQAFAAWRDVIAPLLDRGRMIDEATGRPFDDEGLDAVLRDVFETIHSDGWADRTPGAVAGASSFAKRSAEHRFLHFKDAAGWIAYHAQFGRGTAFDAMMGHIRGMSRDIAAMDLLGPNPESTVRWLADGAQKDAALHGDALGRDQNASNAAADKLDNLWKEYTGSLRRPVNRNLALVGNSYRAIASSSHLGSAMLSAVTDLAFGTTTRLYNGIPAVSIMRDYLKLLNPLDDGDRRLAVRLALGAEGWGAMMGAQTRYLVEEYTSETAKRLGDVVMRASGLQAWTDAGRWGNGLAWLGHLTDLHNVEWAKLSPRLQRAMDRYRIGEAGWEKIRATPIEEDGGAHWIKPQNVEDRELGIKLLEMIHSETDYAVPVADLETRALMNSFAPTGTVRGELIRSGPLLFKSFGIAAMGRHLGRVFEQPTLAGKAGYLALLTVPMTIMGALSLQLREIAKGKDPRATEDPKFWGAAALQGGGFGIAGDVLGLISDPRGDNLASYITGPLGGDLFNTGRAGFALARPIVDHSEKARRAQARAPWQLAKVARDNLPGHNLWYGRLAFDRLVSDQVQAAIDPNYHQNIARAQRQARDQGQRFYWEPGTTSPQRAPDFEHMMEPPPPH